ncbi:SH3 domain and tetratricopeptide repeat-containing protein 1 [Amblyraja radiata]|uniref:SH3 domain and tetratricopeptide repeat-containing protein 1 n=1 Tax=Amblyraja radiata TaxID=386614 RepID=UPI001402FED7|nr:SH3 domain and tetratricopeptide repeat-containing protein 1 [Amblyraja radiata]
METAERDSPAAGNDSLPCAATQERGTLPGAADSLDLPGEMGRVARPPPRRSHTGMEPCLNDISMKLVMKRQRTGIPDDLLQDMLRGKLRILENDCGEVITLLSELSARLLSIYSDQDMMVITFQTFEEIWKFSSYYSLGLIGHCLENLLFDQEFWLNDLNEDAMLDVQMDEDSLKMMRKDLLQKGVFSISYPLRHQRCEEDLQPEMNAIVSVDGATTGSRWLEETTSSGKKVLVPESHKEFIDPFHQWFFKRHQEGTMPNAEAAEFSCALGTGTCVAAVDCEDTGLDELSFQTGDRIQVVGLLSSCMQWFLGENETTRQTGFVKISHMKPDDFVSQAKDLLFVDEAEKHVFVECEKFTDEDSIKLLKHMAQTDISEVYQMDTLEPIDFQEDIKGADHTPSKLDIAALKAKLNEDVCRLKGRECVQSEKEREAIGQDPIAYNRKDAPEFERPHESPQFHVGNSQVLDNTEMLHPLLVFLDNQEFCKDFENLYDSSFSFLTSTFSGYHEVKGLIRYLEVAREAARKRQMQWAQTRLAFLLGRMCAQNFKFSQARVYFEEAQCLMSGCFTDLFLLIAVYTNLVAIYLKQKNQEKYSALFGKIAVLLMGIPNYISSTDTEAEILRYILKKAVLTENRLAEARACFLLAKFHLKLKQYEEGLPFVERLQFLRNATELEHGTSLDFYFTLGSLYYQECLPNLAISCVKRSCLQPTRTLMDWLKCTNFIMKRACKMGGETLMTPTQVAPCLQRALSSTNSLDKGNISPTICLSLSKMYKLHGKYEKAIHYMEMAINIGATASVEEVINALISLAWLHILNSQPTKAIEFLNILLESTSVLNCSVQRGVVYNMIAISMRKMKNVKEALKSYIAAVLISLNSEKILNQAIAHANLGLLCLWSKTSQLSEHLLLKSVHLFFESPSPQSDENLIQVLIMLGHHYIDQELQENGIFCYECALLIALKANLIESQVQVTQLLCQFYSSILPNEAQCIVYNEFLLYLARKLANKELEGHVLQNTSQLYLNLGTKRAFRTALEYTKQSLRIFIDLKKKEEEAYAWLQAGKIYYILEKNELVDVHIQVAQEAAMNTERLEFAMKILEAAGDVFFNGSKAREKAISFYRDQALPLALKSKNMKVELRLCNKLAELLLQLNIHSEALKYAQTALMLSMTLGDALNERVAYHRLATVHHSLGQCEMAEHFYLKALSLCSHPMEFDEETIYYVKVYCQLGDITFYDLKDPRDAENYYHFALAAAMDLGSKKSQLKICTRLATIYHNFLVDREMSLYYYQKARKFAAELNIRRLNLSPVEFYTSTTVKTSKSLS